MCGPKVNKYYQSLSKTVDSILQDFNIIDIRLKNWKTDLRCRELLKLAPSKTNLAAASSRLLLKEKCRQCCFRVKACRTESVQHRVQCLWRRHWLCSEFPLWVFRNMCMVAGRFCQLCKMGFSGSVSLKRPSNAIICLNRMWWMSQSLLDLWGWT